MYVVAVTMEITFTLAENTKKISLFTKKICGSIGSAAAASNVYQNATISES